MLLQIAHSTHYRYSSPVDIEPHQLRFRPRSDGSQSAIQFRLKVSPTPDGFTEQLDCDGNLATFVWFAGAQQELSILAEATVETFRENPFDFLKPPANRRLPSLYDYDELGSLSKSLRREFDNGPQDPVRQLAKKLVNEVGGDAVGFLMRLNQLISGCLEIQHRQAGEPFEPRETLRRQAGACRDAAVLFIDACRSVGVAARFVSGYHLNEDPDEANELHGWAEAYIPNAGWRGFDPSVGILVADEHVSVAASPNPRLTAPITGAYCGPASASMNTQVVVTSLERVPEDGDQHRDLRPAAART